MMQKHGGKSIHPKESMKCADFKAERPSPMLKL